MLFDWLVYHSNTGYTRTADTAAAVDLSTLCPMYTGDLFAIFAVAENQVVSMRGNCDYNLIKLESSRWPGVLAIQKSELGTQWVVSVSGSWLNVWVGECYYIMKEEVNYIDSSTSVAVCASWHQAPDVDSGYPRQRVNITHECTVIWDSVIVYEHLYHLQQKHFWPLSVFFLMCPLKGLQRECYYCSSLIS